MKKKAILGLLIIAVLAVILFGFVLKKGDADKPKYRFDTITKGDIEAIVTTSATINPVDLVDVGSQASGKITKLYVDFNSVVKAGQVVAELDQDDAKSKVEQNQANYDSALASLEQAKVNLENAKKSYDRTLDLFQRNLVSFEAKETAEANFVTAKVGLTTATARVSQNKAALDSSKVNLAYTIIRSPIDGTVITRSVNIGQTVAASFQAPVLFKVASDLTKMQLSCAVDEADIGRVKEGQKVRFTVDAFQGETFTGAVKQVRNAATTTQNVVTYETIVSAENPQGKLKPGMTATVSIITGEARGVLKVSNSALRYTPNIPAEELKKILDAMRAQRQAQDGARSGDGQTTTTPGQTGGTRANGQTGGTRAGGTITPEMMQSFMQRQAQGGRRGGGTVWTLDETGKLKPYFVRTGVTDNTVSEIVRGELKEGMKVILGELGASAATTTTQPGGQRGPGGPGGMMIFR